jgi:hypothetical protein
MVLESSRHSYSELYGEVPASRIRLTVFSGNITLSSHVRRYTFYFVCTVLHEKKV